jgi:hypothetical protein
MLQKRPPPRAKASTTKGTKVHEGKTLASEIFLTRHAFPMLAPKSGSWQLGK